MLICMKIEECVFCKSIRGRERLITDNKLFYSFFDLHPVSCGHALIVPKRHVVSLLNLNSNEWIGLKSSIQKTIKGIESMDLIQIYKNLIKEKITERSPIFCQNIISEKYINKKPEGYNIGVNDGLAAGRTIEHLHIQIIPRYMGDVTDPIGGIRNVIPGLGNYK